LTSVMFPAGDRSVAGPGWKPWVFDMWSSYRAKSASAHFDQLRVMAVSFTFAGLSSATAAGGRLGSPRPKQKSLDSTPPI
jgi:hypothetical protein